MILIIQYEYILKFNLAGSISTNFVKIVNGQYFF